MKRRKRKNQSYGDTVTPVIYSKIYNKGYYAGKVRYFLDLDEMANKLGETEKLLDQYRQANRVKHIPKDVAIRLEHLECENMELKKRLKHFTVESLLSFSKTIKSSFAPKFNLASPTLRKALNYKVKVW